MLFTAHDYGLENCVIASMFPTRGRIAPHRSYSGEGQIQSLEVWQLEEPSRPWSPLDPPTTYAWNTKPARRRLIGTLNATAIRDYTPSFHCPSQSSFLIEVACGSSDCKLDFVQDRAAPRFGKWSRSIGKLWNSCNEQDFGCSKAKRGVAMFRKHLARINLCGDWSEVSVRAHRFMMSSF